ncbi:MAG: FAD-dependent monooxygenase, partial [Paraburkholderia tropica]
MTASNQTFDVAVIGGGLVGKAAALALTQNGLRVALLAQPCAPLPPGAVFDARVYAFSRSSQALFERLRVWQAADPARLTPVYDMRVFGDAAAELHFSAYQASVSQLAWIAESSLIERAMDSALHFQPNLTWIDSRAQTLDVNPSAAVIGLANGRTIEADLAVGADGAHSWVRAQIGATVECRDYRQTGVVANFRAEKPHGECAYQ